MNFGQPTNLLEPYCDYINIIVNRSNVYCEQCGVQAGSTMNNSEICIQSHRLVRVDSFWLISVCTGATTNANEVLIRHEHIPQMTTIERLTAPNDPVRLLSVCNCYPLRTPCPFTREFAEHPPFTPLAEQFLEASRSIVDRPITTLNERINLITEQTEPLNLSVPRSNTENIPTPSDTSVEQLSVPQNRHSLVIESLRKKLQRGVHQDVDDFPKEQPSTSQYTPAVSNKRKRVKRDNHNYSKMPTDSPRRKNHTEEVVIRNDILSRSATEKTFEPATEPESEVSDSNTGDECATTDSSVSNPLCTKSALSSALKNIDDGNATLGFSASSSNNIGSIEREIAPAEIAVTTQTNSLQLTSNVTHQRFINEAIDCLENDPMLINTIENYLVPNTGPQHVIAHNPFDDEFPTMVQRSDPNVSNVISRSTTLKETQK